MCKYGNITTLAYTKRALRIREIVWRPKQMRKSIPNMIEFLNKIPIGFGVRNLGKSKSYIKHHNDTIFLDTMCIDSTLFLENSIHCE